MFKKSGVVKSLALFAFVLSIALLPVACSKKINGAEVKDEFMENFFRPEVKHKSVKVIQTKEGKRYVVVDFGRKLEKEELKQYQISLAKRGFHEYSTGKATPYRWVDILRSLSGESPYSSYEMMIFRPTDEEGVLEFSRNDINPPGADLRGAVNFTGVLATRVAIEIAPEFGKKWEKWTFKPEKEMEGPDARIGKYPGSIRAAVYYDGATVVYYVSDPNENILEYYRDRFSRLKRLKPEIKIDEGVEEFSTTIMYGKTIRPAKNYWLFLDGGRFSITINIYRAYFSEDFRILEIHERISRDEDAIFIEKGVRQ